MTLVFLKTFFYYKCAQARINTGFHRFTEIGQIFHNRYIEEKTFQVARLHPRRRNWSISCVNNSETQERGLWEVKIEKFHIGACPWTPRNMHLWCSFRKSVSIYPRSDIRTSASIFVRKLWLN